MSNEVFEFLNGKRFILNGLKGIFKYERYPVQYPSRQVIEKLSHEPDTDQVQYKKKREEMGDDWYTDLTDDVDRFCAIATLLGYDYDGEYSNPQTEITTKFLLVDKIHRVFMLTYIGVEEPEFRFRNYVKASLSQHRSWITGIYAEFTNVPEEVTNGLIALWITRFPLDVGYSLEDIFNTIDWSKLVEKVKEE